MCLILKLLFLSPALLQLQLLLLRLSNLLFASKIKFSKSIKFTVELLKESTYKNSTSPNLQSCFQQLTNTAVFSTTNADARTTNTDDTNHTATTDCINSAAAATSAT